MKKSHILVVVVFLFGVSLRAMLIQAPFIEDERKNIYIAQQISFARGDIFLPMDHSEVTHPLLNLYLTKLGAAVFGNTTWGLRSIHFILGCLTLLLVYFLAQEWGALAGIAAMTALAVNPYHVHASIRTENTSALLFFTALVIWLFYRAVVTQKESYMVGVGPALGLAFLTKGVSLLLVPAFLLYILADRQQWLWFKRKSPYVALLLFLVVISPWLVWISVHGSDQLMFKPAMYHPAAVGLNVTALNFYLIKLQCALQGIDPRMVTSWEYAAMDGVGGLVMVLAVIWAVLSPKDRLTRLLLIVFAVIVAVLSFFKKPGHPHGEFWWVNISLIPAACLAGRMLGKWITRRKIYRIAAAVIVLYYGANAAVFVKRLPANMMFPPSAMSPLVDQDYTLARLYEQDQKYDLAVQELQRQRRYAPNNIEVDSFLGWLYYGQGRYDEAVVLWARAIIQEPHYMHVTNKLPAVSEHLLKHYLLQRGRHPDDPKLLYFLGVASYFNRQYDQAWQYFDQLTAALPDDPMGSFYQSLISYQKRDFESSARILSALLKDHPGLGAAHYVLGKSYSRLGRYAEAIAAFEQALTLNAQDFKSLYYKAYMYEKLNKTEQAREGYQAALGLLHEDVVIRLRSAQPPPYAKILNMKRGQL
ncbi:MAG: glycosyltransferase family 39 protein [Candidatus Omnitrophica bacterium]|nr:glycosyltransferase family 39 protein [Candidatus Omnitrophota bacterium]